MLQLRPVTVKTATVRIAVLATAIMGVFAFFFYSCWDTCEVNWIMGGEKASVVEQWLILIGSAAAFLGGVYLLAIAIGRPVALRIDEQGLSGYYIPPVVWEDVARIGVWQQPSGEYTLPLTYVGIRMSNSGQLYRGQTPAGREATNKALRRSKYHVLIPQIMLEMDADQVAGIANRFLTEKG